MIACLAFPVITSLLLSYAILLNDCIVENDPYLCLKELKLKHLNGIVYAHLNINSLRNKFEQLKCMIMSAIDILTITETKLGDSYPEAQLFY